MLLKVGTNDYINFDHVWWIKVNGSAVVYNDSLTELLGSGAAAVARAEELGSGPDWVKAQSTDNWFRKSRITKITHQGGGPDIRIEVSGFAFSLPVLATAATNADFVEFVSELFIEQ